MEDQISLGKWINKHNKKEHKIKLKNKEMNMNYLQESLVAMPNFSPIFDSQTGFASHSKLYGHLEEFKVIRE